MGEELAVIEGACETVAGALEAAALGGDGNEPHEEMYVEITADGLETPASSVNAGQRSYCTLGADLFDRLSVSEPTAVLIPVAETLDWFAWLDDEATIRLAVVGEPGAEMASQLRLAGRRARVTLDCPADPALIEEIDLSLPDRFDGRTFLDRNGDPAPTRIETTAGELSRIVGAVHRCGGVDGYPLSVTAGEVRFAVDGSETEVEGRLDAAVEGPGFERQYGHGFGRVVRAVDGNVTLWAGAGEPVAVVTTRPAATFRHVVPAV